MKNEFPAFSWYKRSFFFLVNIEMLFSLLLLFAWFNLSRKLSPTLSLVHSLLVGWGARIGRAKVGKTHRLI